MLTAHSNFLFAIVLLLQVIIANQVALAAPSNANPVSIDLAPLTPRDANNQRSSVSKALHKHRLNIRYPRRSISMADKTQELHKKRWDMWDDAAYARLGHTVTETKIADEKKKQKTKHEVEHKITAGPVNLGTMKREDGVPLHTIGKFF